jgi:predicted DNA binding CopG/RHH family protein
MSEITIKLSDEEVDILRTYEDSEWGSVEEIESEKQRSQPMQRYAECARATFRKDKRVNIRKTRVNLGALQEQALEHGIKVAASLKCLLTEKYTCFIIIRRLG